MVHPSVKTNPLKTKYFTCYSQPYCIEKELCVIGNESWLCKNCHQTSVMILQIGCKYRQNISLEFLKCRNKQLVSTNWKNVPENEKVQTNDSSVCITRLWVQPWYQTFSTDWKSFIPRPRHIILGLWKYFWRKQIFRACKLARF